jgi:2-polyprenyl-3-methyl-5-hydroxy-6-metoxy-1,4-benzoquinol methylase
MSRKIKSSSYLKQSCDYYDRRFGEVEGPDLSEDEQVRLPEILARVERGLGAPGERQGLEILDFGCGRGWLSARLAPWGRVTGVDLSPGAVAHARKLWPQIEFTDGDISTAATLERLGPGRFDAVVSSEVVEHVLNQPGYFHNLLRLLRGPGSIVVLTTPNGLWKRHYFRGERVAWAQPYELWLTAADLEHHLRSELTEWEVQSFHSRWLTLLPTHGLPALAGQRQLLRGMRALGAESRYMQWLDRRGFGLYLGLFARR